MNILIAGFGYVGEKLGEILSHAGHSVVGVRRSAPRPEISLPQIQADLAGPLLGSLPSEVDQIVYAVSADARTPEAYSAAYPTGVSNLRQRYPGARFLFLSSTSVYGQSEGEEVDESCPAEAQGFGPEALRLAEQLALSQGGQRREHAVIRSSGIYGPGRTRFASALRDRSLVPEDDTVFSNRIHRDDLARALAFLLGRPNEGGIFIASDQTPATAREMKTFLDDLLPPRSVPPAGTSGATPRGGAERKNRRFRPARLLSLGFQFTYPSFREGYRTLLG